MSENILSYAQQFLPLESIINARDLGGYTVKNGRTVCRGLLLRAAHLGDATDKDIRYLSQLPVAKVIDFRRTEEKLGNEDRIVPGATHIDLTVDATAKMIDQASDKEKRRFSQKKKFDVKKLIVLLAFNEKAQSIAQEMYPTLFFYPACQQQYARFLREVVDTEKGAVLYHCSQGKDRTGIASALLLAALGADRETIITDFDVTNRIYEADVRKYSRRVRLFGGKNKQLAVVKAFLGANTDNFVNALDRIVTEFGSFEAYLKGPMGLTDQDLQILRDRYLSK